MKMIVLCAALTLAGLPAMAQTVAVVPTEGAVTALVETPRGVWAETERGTVRLEAGNCPGGVCVTNGVIRGLPQRAPEGGLPDGFVASASTGDIRKAWYGKPTERYQHCVLGDCVEGGSLVVEMANGAAAELVLPDSQVFEDITPRLADLEGDGRNEVVTIRASNTGGAAVVVYGLRDGRLSVVAQSAENGRANRWLNIAEILPIEGGSRIVFVRTPHIGGIVTHLDVTSDGVRESRSDAGRRSNHVIGSRELNLSARVESGYVLPSQDRQTLHFSDGGAASLPEAIDKAVVAVGGLIVTATETGQLLAISR